MHLSLKYTKGRGAPSYFPLSAITDRCNARNQLKYKDRYVLIKGDDVIADFESRGDALREGYKRFGHEAFLVKKVEEVEQVEQVEQVNFLSRPLVD
jgi:hypothetical protein